MWAPSAPICPAPMKIDKAVAGATNCCVYTSVKCSGVHCTNKMLAVQFIRSLNEINIDEF